MTELYIFAFLHEYSVLLITALGASGLYRFRRTRERN